jgi:3,4-dihydroxyphenylacetate 2,3-dioxygenase
MAGVIAAAIVAHVPTLSRAEITPEYQKTLVQGERELGDKLRALKPDLWVIASTHWVSTFNWLATCQAEHKGICVADEAPDLIPGLPYHYRGDAAFAEALLDAWRETGLPVARNDSPHYAWDYGTYVPLSHLDPQANISVVGLPAVLMADHAECLLAGQAIHSAAIKSARRVVFLASTALTHALVRGRNLMPTAERIRADENFIAGLLGGKIEQSISGFSEYHRVAEAEIGGRVLATLLGVLRGMSHAQTLAGIQFGGYAQSSGSGNANIVLAGRHIIAQFR